MTRGNGLAQDAGAGAMMRRRTLLAGAAGLMLGLRPAPANSAPPPLVGFAYSGRPTDQLAPVWIAAFADGMAGQGWRGDRALVEIRYSSADPALIPKVADELVALNPAVLFVSTTPNTAALLKRTSTIPLVFVQVSDPVGSGFVDSLSRPGRNATGFTNFEASMAGQWLELLTDLAPATATVGALYNPDTAVRGGRFFVEPLEQAAARLGLSVQPIEVRSDAEITVRVAALGAQRGAGVVVIPDTFVNTHREAIIAAVGQAELAAVYWGRQFAEAGGLVSYGIDIPDHYRAGGDYVGRILNGASPADLPVQAASKYELVINLKTARAQGIAVPRELLATATEVIE